MAKPNWPNNKCARLDNCERYVVSRNSQFVSAFAKDWCLKFSFAVSGGIFKSSLLGHYQCRASFRLRIVIDSVVLAAALRLVSPYPVSELSPPDGHLVADRALPGEHYFLVAPIFSAFFSPAL